MTALVTGLLSQLWPYILAGFAALAVLWQQRHSAVKADRAKRDAKAANERLEMHREATKIEREARDLSDEEAKREALKWSKPRS